MRKYEIGLKKIGRTMTKQTSEGGKAKKTSKDEELERWFGRRAQHQLSPPRS